MVFPMISTKIGREGCCFGMAMWKPLFLRSGRLATSSLRGRWWTVRRGMTNMSSAPSRSSGAVDGAASILPLRLLVFLGSTRPNRMCTRVSSFVVRNLRERGHDCELVDPIDLELPLLRQPVFAYPPGKAPATLAELQEKVKAADGYVIVSPEYNHSFGTAISNTLNHFGGSCFAFKPSLIVTYSIGQFAGIRAAMALRPYLSELGCLPVSSILSFAKVQDVLDPNGQLKEGEDVRRWHTYVTKCIAQLEWIGTAFVYQRQRADPFESSPPNLKMEDRYMPAAD